MFPWLSGTTELPKGIPQRLLRIEAKLDRILDHLGVSAENFDAAPGLSCEVQELARNGRKIEAIKLHREQSGAGLKVALEAVEAYLGV